MLGRKTYSKGYIDGCRAQVAEQVAAFRAVADAAGAGKVAKPVADFEPTYFNALVIVLDTYFVHRLRGVEGKNGNPLNEVRVLAASLMEHGGLLTVEKAITLKPESSVLGLSPGEPVRLTETQFTILADAFFADIEAKFAEP